LLAKQPGARTVEAILFSEDNTLPEAINAVYRLDVNEYNGLSSLQLVIEHWETSSTLLA
jgi:single-stranded-DNA-specific exonuclease